MITLDKDYYKILGVSRDANISEIKSSYRKLVMKYHPDVSRTKDTEEMFKLINEAYTVLSNPTLREKYDQKLSEVHINLDESPLLKVIKAIKNNIRIAINELHRFIDEISSDKFLERLSNEELLQRIHFSENELVKIAALKILRQRRKRSVIPYLVEIAQSSSIPNNIKTQIKQTLKDLGYDI